MERNPAKQSEQHILIVGDKDVKILAGALAAKKYAVLVFPGGKGLIDAVRDNPPDLILLDINLPETDGCEVCWQIKADAGLKDIPVIFVGALNAPVDKARLFGAGGADYITRPFEIPEVEARVGTHLELRRQRRELEESRAQLRETEELRDNFVHMLAHDLRNTLTAISGYLELIGMTGRDTLPEKGLQYVKKGTESVSTLVDTLNTMSDVSKMESGTMRLNLTRFDLVPLVRKVLSDMAPQATRTELVPPRAGGRADVTGDQDILRRVAQTLVGNALKSAGKNGPVKVGIEDRPDCVRISVEDNGPVIPPDRLARVFVGFGDAEGASGGKTYSQGLGFTFCRLAVEAHGGRIGAESSPGAGNVFWFELTKDD